MVIAVEDSSANSQSALAREGTVGGRFLTGVDSCLQNTERRCLWVSGGPQGSRLRGKILCTRAQDSEGNHLSPRS